jgi:hypothetical protein
MLNIFGHPIRAKSLKLTPNVVENGGAFTVEVQTYQITKQSTKVDSVKTAALARSLTTRVLNPPYALNKPMRNAKPAKI